MLQRILEQEEAVSGVLLASGKVRDRDMMLHWNYWALKCRALQVRWNHWHMLQLCCQRRKTHPFLWSNPYSLHGWKKHMCSSDDDSAGVADLESTIATSLHGHFTDPEMKKLTLMSSAIDPQFKSLRSSEKEEVYANLKTAAIALQQPDEPVEVPSANKRKSNTEDILEYRESNGSSCSDAPDDTVDREAKQYKFEPQIERDEDPLERWKTHQAHLKCLSCLAKRFCVCREHQSHLSAFSVRLAFLLKHAYIQLRLTCFYSLTRTCKY